MKIPPLEDRHCALISIVADALADNDAWPFYPYVEAILDHRYGLRFEHVMDDMPARLVWAQSGYGGQSPIMASVAALAQAAFARDELERYVAVVRRAAELEHAYVPPPQGQPELRLPPDEVRKIALPDGDADGRLSRLLALVEAEAVLAFTGVREGDWALQLDHRVRPYRGVVDVEDYVERRPLPQPSGSRVPEAAPSAPGIFIVMPFEKRWSKNVHDTISRACADVAELVGGLTWQRADEIAEPGRITDQIVNAIETADVIVADLTGSNPNVMFELGYADAAGKPIVALNQDLDATPFDIKDWRQIRYDIHDLEAARRQLVLFIRGALTKRRRGG